ncbi:MAG: histidinol-phosphatase [Campylobacterales bacterium]|nr:histidinol-phosphatase [Campylobacterales bacterium]
MKIDLHNHTPLCNHALGTPEAYLQAAIEEGIDVFGFSDHAPMHFDPKYRMSFDQCAQYESEILELKSRFADRIEVLLGYEVDYLPGYMDERILNAKVDYLIGSIHFIDEWGFDNPEFIGHYAHEDINVIWQRYFDLIEAMANSRLFDIVGHLDLIKVFKFLPKRPIGDIAAKALEAIKAADMTIELNAAGFRKPIGEAYPSDELLRMAYALEIPITFGSDAHAPEQVGLFRDKLEAMAKAVGYTKCAKFVARKRELVTF